MGEDEDLTEEGYLGSLSSCCPHCGGDLLKGPPGSVRKGDWILFQETSFYMEVRVPITPSQSRILCILATAPDPVSAELLACQITTSEDSHLLILRVQISKMRKILKALGITDPIMTGIHGDYVWNPSV